MTRCGCAWLASAMLLGAACGAREPLGLPEPIAAPSSLGDGVVARVGGVPLAAERVAAVAAARGVSARRALELEVADALLENAARAAGHDERAWVRAAVRGVLARSRLERVRAESSLAEVQSREVEDATARHFVELDRPDTFRVVHALIKLPDRPDDSIRARARVVAEALAARVAGALDEPEFRARAESLAARDGFDVVVESLSPVASDGRVVNLDPPAPGGSYEEPFARAASRLQRVGEQSAVVATPFGFHVLMLLEKLPAHVVPYAERAILLRDEILTARAKEARTALVKDLRARAGASVERSAESLMASVDVTPHEGP